MPKGKCSRSARSQKIVDSACVPDAVGSAVLCQR
jgi:hypothetical protein